MKLAKWHTQEDKQNLREAMLEQAYNNILLDGDRIEKYIEENSDVLQDILFKHKAYDMNKRMNKRMDDEELQILCATIGAEIVANVLLGIENMASEDVEEALR